jgi:hypothetical protein
VGSRGRCSEPKVGSRGRCTKPGFWPKTGFLGVFGVKKSLFPGQTPMLVNTGGGGDFEDIFVGFQ